MKDKVWCIFYCDDDGYTCSSQTLVGVFLTEEDAQKTLEKHCAAAKTYFEEILPRKVSHMNEVNRQHRKYSPKWFEREKEINAEVDLWCVQNEIDENALRSVENYNIEYYEINEVPLEEIF